MKGPSGAWLGVLAASVGALFVLGCGGATYLHGVVTPPAAFAGASGIEWDVYVVVNSDTNSEATLDRLDELQGTGRDDDGTPLPTPPDSVMRQIRADAEQYGEPFVVLARTNDDGTFRTPALAADIYYVGYYGEYITNRAPEEPAVFVTKGGDPVEQVVTPRAILEGSVVNASSKEPVTHAIVALELLAPSSSTWQVQGRVDAPLEGKFRFVLEKPGRYRLAVQATNYDSIMHSPNPEGASGAPAAFGRTTPHAIRMIPTDYAQVVPGKVPSRRPAGASGGQIARTGGGVRIVRVRIVRLGEGDIGIGVYEGGGAGQDGEEEVHVEGGAAYLDRGVDVVLTHTTEHADGVRVWHGTVKDAR